MSGATDHTERPTEGIPRLSDSNDPFVRWADKMTRSRRWDWLTDAFGQDILTINIRNGNGDTTVYETRPLRPRETTAVVDQLRDAGFETSAAAKTFSIFLRPSEVDNEYQRLCALAGDICQGGKMTEKSGWDLDKRYATKPRYTVRRNGQRVEVSEPEGPPIEAQSGPSKA